MADCDGSRYCIGASVGSGSPDSGNYCIRWSGCVAVTFGDEKGESMP